MILIAISGAKNSKKNLLAMKLAGNSDCKWVRPYTNKQVPVNQKDWEMDEYIHLNDKQLEHKKSRDKVLLTIDINGSEYVYFEYQMNSEYVVIVGDDRVISYFKDNWDGKLITVKCHSNSEKYSERNLLNDSEFDIVYNYDTGDYDDFEAKIVYGGIV